MYTPNAYREDRLEVMHAFVAANPFAAIATPSPDGLVVDHAPLVLLPGDAPYGTLIGHLARANPHLQRLGACTASVAIFQGANAYVSPRPRAERESGRQPTARRAIAPGPRRGSLRRRSQAIARSPR